MKQPPKAATPVREEADARIGVRQPVGHGASDPFNSTAISINEFQNTLLSTFKSNYPFQSMERHEPGSGYRWLHSLIADEGALYGLYAFSFALKTRNIPEDAPERRKLQGSALKHHSRALAIARQRLGNAATLVQDAYLIISLLTYESNTGDMEAYRTHYYGLKNVLALMGGIRGAPRNLRLIMLVGIPLSSGFLLIRPIYGPENWDCESWHEEESIRHVAYRYDMKPRYAQAYATDEQGWKMPKSLRDVLADMQEFHAVLRQTRSQADQSELSDVHRWLNTRAHLLSMKIITVYCDITDSPSSTSENNKTVHHQTEGKAILQALNVAILCCHQLLYNATPTSQIVKMRYIPFRHIKSRLEIVNKILGPITDTTPEHILAILTWTSFIGACGEIITEGVKPHAGSTTGLNARYFLKLLALNPVSVTGGFEKTKRSFDKILYDELVLDPLLRVFWHEWATRLIRSLLV